VGYSSGRERECNSDWRLPVPSDWRGLLGGTQRASLNGFPLSSTARSTSGTKLASGSSSAKRPTRSAAPKDPASNVTQSHRYRGCLEELVASHEVPRMEDVLRHTGDRSRSRALGNKRDDSASPFAQRDVKSVKVRS
jgi:hypothetical protein